MGRRDCLTNKFLFYLVGSPQVGGAGDGKHNKNTATLFGGRFKELVEGKEWSTHHVTVEYSQNNVWLISRDMITKSLLSDISYRSVQ